MGEMITYKEIFETLFKKAIEKSLPESTYTETTLFYQERNVAVLISGTTTFRTIRILKIVEE
jgi:hypothetical protein